MGLQSFGTSNGLGHVQARGPDIHGDTSCTKKCVARPICLKRSVMLAQPNIGDELYTANTRDDMSYFEFFLFI